MFFNYLGLGVKLKYPLLLLVMLGGMPRQGFRCDEPGRFEYMAQMGALWRWARLGPMRLG